MTELQRLIDAFDELCGRADTFPKSSELGKFPNAQNLQVIENNHISHLSQFPTSNQHRSAKNFFCSNKTTIEAHESGPRELPCANVGNVGNVGSSPDILAEATSYDFPLSHSLLGKEEGKWEIGRCGLPVLDLNHAATLAAAFAPQLAPTPPPGDPLPISPADVRAGVERELRALAMLGRTGPDAERDAIEVTRAKIRNSQALVEQQAHDGRCHACGEPLDGTWPEVAILQARSGSHLWVHAGDCHSEHIRRRAALVEEIMRSAGYGADRREGEAA